MKYSLRRAFYYENEFHQHFVDELHASTDPDSIFLSTLIEEPMHHLTAATALKANGSPIALVYAAFMSWDHSQLPLFQLDHPLVDFMKADTPFSFVKAARKWNEPFLWDHVVLRTRSYTREAAQANSPWGLLWHAYTADYLRPVERVDLHRRAYDILPSMRGPNLDFIDDYRNGRFLHVIGSSACSADQKYYLKHRERATRATCTWLVIAKRLGLYRDIARLIGMRVYQHRRWDQLLIKRLKK